jgi:hypothetical protein
MILELLPKQKVEWERLPLDILVEVRGDQIFRFLPPIQINILRKEHILTVMPFKLQIGKFVAEIDGNVAAMRATCKHWNAGVASVSTALTPLVSWSINYINFN